jgi:hypothetical protein
MVPIIGRPQMGMWPHLLFFRDGKYLWRDPRDMDEWQPCLDLARAWQFQAEQYIGQWRNAMLIRSGRDYAIASDDGSETLIVAPNYDTALVRA